ncbi:hypothetical protein BCR34DRAFT_635525, partial [Clohesyomyces aquaticus]
NHHLSSSPNKESTHFSRSPAHSHPPRPTFQPPQSAHSTTLHVPHLRTQTPRHPPPSVSQPPSPPEQGAGQDAVRQRCADMCRSSALCSPARPCRSETGIRLRWGAARCKRSGAPAAVSRLRLSWWWWDQKDGMRCDGVIGAVIGAKAFDSSAVLGETGRKASRLSGIDGLARMLHSVSRLWSATFPGTSVSFWDIPRSR